MSSPLATSETPKVAAVVPAYNSEATIVAAVESLLNGTMPCKVYVVDDCSRIPVADSLSHLRDRVTIMRMDRNVGPAFARNIAIKRIIADGFKYVAIADADDVSEPTRIQRQVEFMEAHPQVGACGAWCMVFEKDIAESTPAAELPTEPEDVRKAMFLNMAVSHASALIRAEALTKVGLYRDEHPVAEDYELFRRIGRHYDLASLPEYLLHYRLSPSGQSQSRRRRQLFDRMMIQLKYFELGQWRSYAGVLKTLVTLAVPHGLFKSIKFSVLQRPST